MKRREFIKLSSVASAGAVVSPTLMLGGCASKPLPGTGTVTKTPTVCEPDKGSDKKSAPPKIWLVFQINEQKGKSCFGISIVQKGVQLDMEQWPTYVL